jgi:hypothetical protein
MKPDEFEQQLRSQPLREAPSEWRAEILTAARAARPALSSRVPGWREWLWPCPQAWAGLAAVWMLLLGLHVTAPSRPSALASQSPSLETQTALAAQRRELARLLDAPADAAPTSKPSVPGPRSERASPIKV